MKSTTKQRLSAFAASLGLTLLLGGIHPAAAEFVPPNQDFAKNPPKPTSLMLQRISDSPSQASSNSRLFVKFQTDRRLGSAVNLQLGDARSGPTPVHDDGVAPDAEKGDGIFTADLFFDFTAFTREQGRRASFAKFFGTTPVFKGRQLTERLPIEFVTGPVKVGQIIDLSRFIGIAQALAAPRTLVITDPGVVNDPTRTFDVCTNTGNPSGVWTFNHLMTEMANQPATGIDPSDLTRRWLQNWQNITAPNVRAVAARNNIANLVINSWPLNGAGKLDLARAPFRLLAIVNRVDLRENTLYGGGNAGEARLVFGVIDRNNCGSVPQFTVIFEYGVPKSGCVDVRSWGQQWAALNTIVPGTAAFNTALAAITNQFTVRNADPSKLPNKSALNQLRTNEIALAAPWELREFRLFNTDSDAGFLRQVTVKQTPDLTLNNGPTIRDYINGNQADILAGTNVVPLFFPNVLTPFLAGSALTPFGLFWNGPALINSNQARHLFSLNTCNGCHAGETNTVFTHIKPRAAANMAGVSGFMVGITVNDPVSGTPRNFNEFMRRAADLDNLVNSSCLIGSLNFQPLLATH